MDSLGHLCRSNGFWGKDGAYFRVQGDGVLSCVYQKESTFIDPESSEYSSKKRTGKYIMVGLWSLYAELPEDLFDGKIVFGWLSPMCFIGDRGIQFYGPQHELKLMREEVIPQLDDIMTQTQLVDTCVKLTKIKHRGFLPPQLDLCAAFLKCNREAEALERVESAFTYSWIRCIGDQCDVINAEESITVPVSSRERKRTQKLYRLWAMIAGEQRDTIHRYLEENYNKNLAKIEAIMGRFSTSQSRKKATQNQAQRNR